jgi:hypothetical protein
METEKLKSIVTQAQEAVAEISDEALKKIAFQKILDSLLMPSQTTIPLQSLSSAGSSAIVHNTNLSNNISEFVHEKNQKSHFNIVISMAYYLHFKGEGDFTIEDIQESYGKCLIPKPKNITDIINQNIRKSLIIKCDKEKNGKQTYHISKTGIDYVNSNFTLKSKSSYKPKKDKKKEDKI